MFEHSPVLLKEAVEGLDIKEDGIYVDCTLGGGGHSEEIAKRLSDKGKLYAFDQDEQAVENARERLRPYGQVEIIRDNFRHLEEQLEKRGIKAVDGILYDLGVSSPQLDQPERGFSYQHDAPLDMRMDRSRPLTAKTIVNEWPYEKLAEIFFQYGEERFSRQIARRIVKERERKPIETTFELAGIIKDAIPAPLRRKGGHPARRVFQAIRIAVNDELAALEESLEQAVRLLGAKGRVAVITFHSLEDRICKRIFKKYSDVPDLPRGLPVVPEDRQPVLKIVTKKPVLPSEEELERNPRSRSAKLRIAEKLKQS
ncbi:MAG: 16S rRNA (cytosine(1402)-N(4))-methyltransferase RsmH [Caldibacillus debilis]|jgi:16S rRNA (cytosine1402-N4)-methyltransferase|uniref:Ribosomal RNA small subunit methyltransferase H n=2 Tax=Caldibacillus debilis TaxID=301148 RepID=A0A420VJM6_9BACI|nr:16S rRNA (cytosine(1402)-N(4))-methyltransferase RsmH [Caldibacillus debilis]MBO2480519.1 16S rRNA (cytosine(1402)-N(4))-methyltransferase RsmH [Bacillaceae bacterium]KYD13238.1 hypothetical protein B4135_2985 [Caldibacillus debilis]MBY6271903.1 16S rRNA (cytosine(1402)-N(4))-methyltransferase RsmH [Bacillaceae bacterium]OUM89474.1 MAG: 16S rRNA (cytosine(1402)-N(4))-methyltransferase [Caldibacillus debilis]REJ13751.1 MAG: 16S rRNA (cytosine(1402)-N(4))-methyltransferase RsmH [Caldibacillus